MYELILQNIAKHISLNDQECDFFISKLKLRKLRKRQFLVQAGEICNYESFVTKGCLRQYYLDESGLEHTVMFAIEDWWTSDMYSMVTGKPALTNVDAIEDSEILSIKKEDLEMLLTEVPKFERLFRILLQKAFVAHQQRLYENMSLPAEERYTRLREQHPEFELRIPQRYIASFLGITPESLSRIRRQKM